MAAIIVKGDLKDYAWGRINGLAPWTGSPTSGPEAELWFGTHHAGPSPVEQTLGQGEAPVSTILVKLLAAAKPLSIQVHPDVEAMGWIHQHNQQHLLADDGLKAEMLIAIEPFDVLVGLRDVRSATRLLMAFGPEFAKASQHLEHGGWRELIRWLLEEAPAADIDAAIRALSGAEQRIMARVCESFSGDPSLPVAFMMQPHALAPGEAVFVNVGTIHAYVGGLGVEVMVSCDNVLRLGLTPKEIAVEAALSALNPVGVGVLIKDASAEYYTSGMPFSVNKVTDDASIPAHSTVVCVAGTATIFGPEGTAQLSQGEAALIDDSDQWKVSTTSTVWIATPKKTA